MQAIKDLVCSDDPVNHQLGLMLAFTEYGKSFETFMMVLDWHSNEGKSTCDNSNWKIDFNVSNELNLFCDSSYSKSDPDIGYIWFLDNEEDYIEDLYKLIQYSNYTYMNSSYTAGEFIFKFKNKNKIFYLKSIERQLKSIYHFLTYYDII